MENKVKKMNAWGLGTYQMGEHQEELRRAERKPHH